jgi:DNA mismatch endonuclease, patch repair protein
MAKIKSRNTKFKEDFIRELKKRTNRRFTKNEKLIKGKPDIVFEKIKVCVFLDSDFWHGWQYPRWKHLLKDDFWRDKIKKNRVRDKKTSAYLRRNGWTVLRLWEHSIKMNKSTQINKILQLLQK